MWELGEEAEEEEELGEEAVEAEEEEVEGEVEHRERAGEGPREWAAEAAEPLLSRSRGRPYDKFSYM